MRRRVPPQRSGRRKVAGAAASDSVTLDDRPLALELSHDRKRLIVTLPYEVWIVNVSSLVVERTVELQAERPAVSEAESEGTLWFGGPHLYRGSMWSSSSTKVGTKLGGYVDRVCLIRSTLLCGVGSHGEVLWDIAEDQPIHKRKASEHEVLGLVAAPDGRAVWVDGSHNAWVIDPEHPSGYMKLKFRSTSEHEVAPEGIVSVGLSTEGRCLMAARDGGVAWTNRALRPIDERFPRIDTEMAPPLAIAGDERWIYVLRSGGLLHRFLVEQPPEQEEGDEPEAEPLPEAQLCRLQRIASCVAVAGEGTLLLGGPQSDNQLGRLWRCRAEDLKWEDLATKKRRLVEGPAQAVAHKAPSFVATRSKLDGPALAQLKVDDVLAGSPGFYVTRAHGSLLERPVARCEAEQVRPADCLLLPAMVRFHEGMARPALLLWPGLASDDGEAPELQWLAWGDAPRGWTPLETPNLREQGWSRREVFPLQAALARAPPQIPGHRAPLPERWIDSEHFGALARECKKLLKVLW